MKAFFPTPVIAPGAQVPQSCTIGPLLPSTTMSVLGEECKLISHVVLDGRTRIGARNVFYPFCSIGVPPQDLKYQGEPTETVIGDDNTIRESVTISRGTIGGGGVTRLGSSCLLMTLVHIGHDSHVGSYCIFGNAATLAGHVTIEDYATVNALSATSITAVMPPVEKYAYVGGGTMVTQDVLPFALISAKRENKAFGMNTDQARARNGATARAPGTPPKGISRTAGFQAQHHPGARKAARYGRRGRGCVGGSC